MMRRILTVSGLFFLLGAAGPGWAVEPPDEMPVAASRSDDGSRFSISPGARFRDCEQCPEMVLIPPGRFKWVRPKTKLAAASTKARVTK